MPENVTHADAAAGAVRRGDRSRFDYRTKLQSFSNWSPRVSATYDLTGTGKTSVNAAWSYYYDTRITLANNLGGLFTETRLTWGPNQSSGSVQHDAGRSVLDRRQSRQRSSRPTS